MRRRSDGFTLVELMVVVLIIGILVAIAVPVFKAAKANAAWSACLANQRAIQSAIETYNATHTEAASLNNVYYLGEQTTGDNWSTRLIPEYFRVAPKCNDPGRIAEGRSFRAYFIDSADSYDSGLAMDDVVVGCIWTPDSGWHWRALWK